MTPEDLATLVAHTTVLGAQMEINHTLIEIDTHCYDARLAGALSMASLASLTKDGGFYNGSLIAAGVSPQAKRGTTSDLPIVFQYCWCFAAQVLIQFIQTNEGKLNELHETGLANIVNALEKLSVTFPTLGMSLPSSHSLSNHANAFASSSVQAGPAGARPPYAHRPLRLRRYRDPQHQQRWW